MDDATLLRHLDMLAQEGLIEAKVHRDGNEADFVLVSDMTWAGHDLIGILENDSVWEKIKQTFTPAQLGTLTLSVIKTVGTEILMKWAMSQVLGVPPQ